MTQHTIILTQSHATRKESRSWEDYQTLHLAVEGVISKFETKLKELNPAVRNIHYDINDLHTYIDSFPDFCLLIFDPQSQSYIPHDREWFKTKVFYQLKKAAGHR